MKNRIDKRITIGIGCFLILVMFLLISSKTPTSRYFDSLIQKIVPIPLDSKYYFADEIIPIENFDVSERLERELLSNTYQHTSTILHLKLAKRYVICRSKRFLAIYESDCKRIRSRSYRIC